MYNQFPYSNFNSVPYNSFGTIPKTSGLNNVLGLSKKSFNWDSFLNNAQRTLNVINQAMPIYNQVRPMFRNMGTIFKVIGELNNPGIISSVPEVATSQLIQSSAPISSAPQFFA